MAFALPSNLVAAAERDLTPGLRHWVGRLPELVSELVERWKLQHVGQPFQPGGQGSWVAPVRDGAGRDRVLKVGWRHIEATHEADGLRFWAGGGSVILHAAEAFNSTSALLLERCLPGTPLSQVAAESDQDLIVAQLLLRLWCEPAQGHPFRPLQLMCDQWADEFEAKRVGAPELLDPGLIRDGVELLRGLPATASRSVLLCTDLHAENILATRREPWLVIDPKPYVGDPTYDPLQHMLNCPDRLANDPVGFVRRMVDLLDLDADRLTAWLFARCVQESMDTPALADVARRLAP